MMVTGKMPSVLKINDEASTSGCKFPALLAYHSGVRAPAAQQVQLLADIALKGDDIPFGVQPVSCGILLQDVVNEFFIAAGE